MVSKISVVSKMSCVRVADIASGYIHMYLCTVVTTTSLRFLLCCWPTGFGLS